MDLNALVDIDALMSSWRTSMPLTDIVWRMLAAMGFGAVIGIDRELRDHPAGLRTHMLTALAAALFAILTFELYHQTRAIDRSTNADPIRIVEAVTAGVAFLAAGAIIHGRGTIRGLTTGASMWVAGAIGLACGASHYAIAGIAVVLALIILTLLGWVESWLKATSSPDTEGGSPHESSAGRLSEGEDWPPV